MRTSCLIGEASHGTSEFYRIRAEITKALIEHKNFDFVAVEADWPDAYRIHDFVTHKQREEPHDWEAFARFPTWMWRNHEVLDFIHWLRDFNLTAAIARATGRFLWVGSLQPVHVDSLRVEVSRPRRSRGRGRGAGTLRMSDAVGSGSRHLRPGSVDRALSQLRSRSGADAPRSLPATRWKRRSKTGKTCLTPN